MTNTVTISVLNDKDETEEDYFNISASVPEVLSVASAIEIVTEAAKAMTKSIEQSKYFRKRAERDTARDVARGVPASPSE